MENLVNLTDEEFEKKYKETIFNLSTTQDKIKRDNNLYNEEFKKILDLFMVKFNIFLEAPNKKIFGIKELFLFFSHIASMYPKEIAFLPLKLINLIENNYSIINPEIRLSIVESLSLLRKKDLLTPLEILPLFFKLLRCQDKILRKRLQEMIITDLNRINSIHKNNVINKKLQNFCIENMLTDPNKKAARKTLNIIISLYKKKIWNDTKTVNAISEACKSNDVKIVLAACRFFLSEYEEEEDDSDDEELDELKCKYKLLGKANNRKTKARKNKLKVLMKAIERREQRKSRVKVNKDFMPIDQLNDPTTFTEKLFSKLKSLKENFNLKVILMRLIGRIIGRHKIIINNYFNFMQNFVNSNQKDLPIIFAAIIEACHNQTPPNELECIVNKLFDNFISDALPAHQVTIGLNALREICERCPYIMKKEYFMIVESLKEYKNKSVTIAARGVINLYKDINSNVIGIYDKDEEKEILYGQNKVTETIEGIDLLRKHENLPDDFKMEYETILDDQQLKKLKILRMKYNAEKIQHTKLKLNKNDINQMAGEHLDKNKRINNIDENEDELDLEDDEDLEDYEDNEDLEDIDDFEDNEDLEDIEDFEDNDDNPLNKELELHESDDERIEIDSEEMKSNSDESEEQNVHGFIDPENLLTYRKRYREKKDQLKNQEKEKYVHTRKEKAGGKTNKQLLKNKPLMMIIRKKKGEKKKEKEKVVSLNKKIKIIKQQLGRFKRGNMTLKKKGGLTRKK